MASPSTTTHMVMGHCLANWTPPNKNQAVATGRSINASLLVTPANYPSITTIDARLTAINGTVYTQARLNTMNLNDKLYALAQTDDPGFVR